GIVNCLLLEPDNLNGGFVESAAARHLAILGVIHSGDAAVELGRRALRVKLTGIALEGEFEHEIADRIRAEAGGKLTVIELPSRSRMRLDSNDPIVGTSQALWPGIEIQHCGTVSTAARS